MTVAELLAAHPGSIYAEHVCVFSAGVYAEDIDPKTGEPTSYHEWAPADITAMAANGQLIESSGQGTPTMPGWIPLRSPRTGHDDTSITGVVGWAHKWSDESGKLFANLLILDPKSAAAYNGKQLLGHSVEIVRDGSAVNYRDTSGPVVYAIALLGHDMPRVKTLAAIVCSERARNITSQYSGSARACAYADGASRFVFSGVSYMDPSILSGGLTVESVVALLTLAKKSPDQIDGMIKIVNAMSGAGGAKPADAPAADPAAAAASDAKQMGEIVLLRTAANAAKERETAATARADKLEKGLATIVTERNVARVDQFCEAMRAEGFVTAADLPAFREQLRADVAAVPVLETFSEAGSDQLEPVFARARKFLGSTPRVARTATTVASTAAAPADRTEAFSEQSFKDKLKADPKYSHMSEVAINHLVKKAKAEHEAKTAK